MKKIILFTALLSLICLPVFSQVIPCLNLNDKGYSISAFENRIPFYSIKSFDFTSFMNDSVYTKKLFIPRIPDSHLFFGRVPVRKQLFSRFSYNMPCMKPEGNFSPMPIMRPYQWVQYSLLIKDE
jgi:hypothetical protein